MTKIQTVFVLIVIVLVYGIAARLDDDGERKLAHARCHGETCVVRERGQAFCARTRQRERANARAAAGDLDDQP